MTIKEQVSIAEVINVLNEACRLDSAAIVSLIETRVECNEGLAKHPTIQVAREAGSDDADDSRTLNIVMKYSVGFLGMINGIFGVDDAGWGTIGAKFDVVCPSNSSHDTAGYIVGRECPVCGSKLTYGKFVCFEDLGKR